MKRDPATATTTVSSEQSSPPIQTLDLEKRNPEYDVSVRRTETTESQEEMVSRLRIAESEAQHKLDQDKEAAKHRRETEREDARHRRNTFWAVFTVLVVTGVGSGLLVAFSDNAENQALGRTSVAAVIGALVGYLGGGLAAPNKKP